ncbi:hypothetical protein CCP3SC1_2530001 [Gammaproteobacteria bacterium]
MKTALAQVAGAVNAPPTTYYQNNVVSLNPETLIMRAIEANVPIEALERLLAMRAELKREMASEAFNRALADFQSNIPPIKKTKTAEVQSKTGRSYTYHYADIADIQKAIAPKMRECGLSATFDTAQDGDTLSVTCTIHHVDGHSEHATFPVPIDRNARMNDTQKVGSALTYGRRYSLCAALGIVTAEDDDDGRSAGKQRKDERIEEPGTPPQIEHISEAQHLLIEARISEYSLDRERVKAWMLKASKGIVTHFSDQNQSQFNQLLAKLDEWMVEKVPSRIEPSTNEQEEEIIELPDLEMLVIGDPEVDEINKSGQAFLRLRDEAGLKADLPSLYRWWEINTIAISELSETERNELMEFCVEQKRKLGIG